MAKNRLFTSDDMKLTLCESDFKQLYDRCRMAYGYPSVAVECPEQAFSYIVKDALNLLNTWLPKIVDEVISVTPYKSDYVLDDYNKIGSILDSAVTTDFLIMVGLPITELSSMSFVMSLAASNDATVITDWVYTAALHNTAKNVFQVIPECTLIQPNIIRICPLPQMNTKMLVRLTIPHDTNLGSLNKFEKTWLIKYCTMAMGKFIGNVRRKYSGITLPVGSLNTSGEAIYNEAKDQEKQLMEELKQYKKYETSYITIG